MYKFLTETKQMECYYQLYVDNFENLHKIIKLEIYVGEKIYSKRNGEA